MHYQQVPDIYLLLHCTSDADKPGAIAFGTQVVHLEYEGYGLEEPDSAPAESTVVALCSCPLLQELKLLKFFLWCACLSLHACNAITEPCLACGC